MSDKILNDIADEREPVDREEYRVVQEKNRLVKSLVGVPGWDWFIAHARERERICLENATAKQATPEQRLEALHGLWEVRDLIKKFDDTLADTTEWLKTHKISE